MRLMKNGLGLKNCTALYLGLKNCTALYLVQVDRPLVLVPLVPRRSEDPLLLVPLVPRTPTCPNLSHFVVPLVLYQLSFLRFFFRSQIAIPFFEKHFWMKSSRPCVRPFGTSGMVQVDRPLVLVPLVPRRSEDPLLLVPLVPLRSEEPLLLVPLVPRTPTCPNLSHLVVPLVLYQISFLRFF